MANAVLLRTLGDYQDEVSVLTIAPDGATLAIVLARTRLDLWEVTTSRLISTLSLSAPLTDVVFTSDGKLLAVSLKNGEIWVWEKDGSLLTSLAIGHEARITFLPNSYILACTAAAQIHFWDLLPTRRLLVLPCDPSNDNHPLLQQKPLFPIACSSDGSQLAAAPTMRGTITCWNLTYSHGHVLASFQTALKGINESFGELLYRPGTHQLFCASTRNIWGFDTATRNLVGQIHASENAWTSFSVARHPYLAGSEYEGNILLWDLVRKKRIATFNAYGEGYPSNPFAPAVHTVVWHPHEPLLITAGLQPWDASGPFRYEIKVWQIDF